jgi:cytidine deaminase
VNSPDSFIELVNLAKEARSGAYAPYSGFAVGAALRAVSGRTYSGCNVENAAYGLTICAERVAVFKAVCEGERRFEALAVVNETMAAPCGSCRQVLAEFGLDMTIILADLEGGQQVLALRDMLPAAFTPASLPASSLYKRGRGSHREPSS